MAVGVGVAGTYLVPTTGLARQPIATGRLALADGVAVTSRVCRVGAGRPRSAKRNRASRRVRSADRAADPWESDLATALDLQESGTVDDGVGCWRQQWLSVACVEGGPPGTCTWNKIEHRLFCHITLHAQHLRHGAQRAEGRRSAAAGRLCVGRRQAGTPRGRAHLLPYLHNRIGTSRVGHERPPRGLRQPRLPVPTLPRGTASRRDGPRAPARARTHVALGRATEECGCMRGGWCIKERFATARRMEMSGWPLHRRADAYSVRARS